MEFGSFTKIPPDHWSKSMTVQASNLVSHLKFQAKGAFMMCCANPNNPTTMRTFVSIRLLSVVFGYMVIAILKIWVCAIKIQKVICLFGWRNSICNSKSQSRKTYEHFDSILLISIHWLVYVRHCMLPRPCFNQK